MSLNHSPSVVTNGLVMYYDMNNTKKSWLGNPTTNLFPVPTPAVDTSVTFPAQGEGGFYRITSGNYGGYDITASDVVYKYNLTNNTGCHYHGVGGGPITSGQAYTFSFDYYADSSVTGYPSTNYLANFEGGLSGSVADPTPSIVGVWKRISFTATASSTTANFLLYPGACGAYLGTGGFILYKNPQVELGSYSTPFVEGTRASTRAIVDLTGNNTITATSLTYASDNTFSFNGSSGSVTVPFNSSLFTFNSEQTIILWMKNQSPSSARRNPYNQAYAGGGTITHENDTTFSYYWGSGGGDNSPYSGFSSGFSVVVGETAMVCLTRNVSTISYYKNGVFSNSTTNPYGSGVVTGTSDITIGSGYAGYFGGNLYAVQLYNRALSATEVAQNFNALRGRYSL